MKKIKTAVIPLGGYGTRMYPMTKIIGKEFLPLKDEKGMIKPAILFLIEEVLDAGIEKIYLIITKESFKMYKKFFLEAYCSDTYDAYLKDIYKHLNFVYDEDHKGMGNAIKKVKEKIKEDYFLLLLGDQIYKSNTKETCLKQILSFYKEKNVSILAVSKTNINDASKYGILYGNDIKDNYFEIEKIVEKPSFELVQKELIMKDNNIYSVFGSYILNSSFFTLLDKNDNFSECLEKYVKENKCIAFIPDGNYYDIGNIDAYCKTFKSFL